MTSRPPDDGTPPPGWGSLPPGQVWQPPPGNRRNPFLVIVGILTGLGLGFFALPWLGIWLGSGAAGTAGDSSSAEALGVIGIVLGFGLPILLGIALLIPRRLRQAGAGVLMGISIGMIVGSASCLGIWGLFIAAMSSGHG